jgi:putative membrane protein
MLVDYRGSIVGLLTWQWKAVTLFLGAAVAIVVLDRVGHLEGLRIPALPLGVVGGAIGIFVSFRTNSGYDRWWEARKLWGQLVNLSRHFSSQVHGYLANEPAAVREELVRRHIAYVHTLRCLLREQKPLDDQDVRAFLSGSDLELVTGQSNMTHALLHRQHLALTALADDGRLDARRLQSLDETMRGLLDVQGGCERIQKTPFPRGYGFIAQRLIVCFGVLLPLGLVESLGWLAVPLSLLVNLAFALINEVGRVLETPFTMFWPALPLSALSKTIEINLRERMGETDVPPLPQQDARGILM